VLLLIHVIPLISPHRAYGATGFDATPDFYRTCYGARRTAAADRFRV